MFLSPTSKTLGFKQCCRGCDKGPRELLTRSLLFNTLAAADSVFGCSVAYSVFSFLPRQGNSSGIRIEGLGEGFQRK